MTVTFDVKNVRKHTRKDGNSVPRAILSDPEGTVERFFHFDCKSGEEEHFESLKGKQTRIEIHNIDTNYSDTVSIAGKLIHSKS